VIRIQTRLAIGKEIKEHIRKDIRFQIEDIIKSLDIEKIKSGERDY
jgi:hypothetical protein